MQWPYANGIRCGDAVGCFFYPDCTVGSGISPDQSAVAEAMADSWACSAPVGAGLYHRQGIILAGEFTQPPKLCELYSTLQGVGLPNWGGGISGDVAWRMPCGGGNYSAFKLALERRVGFVTSEGECLWICFAAV